MPTVVSRFVRRILTTALVVAPAATAAQPPAPPPCVERTCGVVIDWGPGKTAASFAPDLRYGSADDFEVALRRALISHAVRLQEAGVALVITVRPRMDTRALCDRMPGTSSRMTCIAMRDVAVSFASQDSTVKAPGAIRLTNRCGENTYATMSQFGQYVGEAVWISLASDGKGKKPPLRC